MRRGFAIGGAGFTAAVSTVAVSTGAVSTGAVSTGAALVGVVRAGLFVLLAATVTLTLCGCNGGIIALALLLGLDDDDDDGSSALPPPPAGGVQVEIVSVENARSKPAETIVTFSLKSDPASSSEVKVEFAPEGEAKRPATVTPIGGGAPSGAGGVANLPSSPGGSLHRVRWNALGDLAGDDALHRVRLEVSSATATDARDVFIGNDPPELVDVQSQSRDGDIEIRFGLADSSEDPTDVMLHYVLGLTDPATAPRKTGTALGRTTGLASAPRSTHSFTWRARQDLGRIDRRAAFIVTPRDRVDGVDGKTGTPKIIVVELDANGAATATLLSAEYLADGDARRGQRLDVIVEDPDSDPVDLIVQWAAEGGTFPELPADIDSDPARRDEILGDPELRRELQIATLLPQVISGPAEQPAAGVTLEDDQVLASWLKHDAELRGLKGLVPGAGGATVNAASIVGGDVVLESAGGAEQPRKICRYDSASGVLTVDSPFDPPPGAGDLLRLELAASSRLSSSPEGLLHQLVWASAADIPGGGPARVRVTPFDLAADLAPPRTARCGDAEPFPADNAIVSSRGVIGVTAEPKLLHGPFGSLSTALAVLPPQDPPTAMVSEDVDADGRLDLIVTVRDIRAVFLLLQTAAGTFETRPLLDARMGAPRGLVVADADGDGDRDIVSCGEDPPAVAIFFQEPNLDFISRRSILRDDARLAEPAAIALADLDGDGDQDIAVADAAATTSAAVVFFRGASPLGGCGAERLGYTACAVGPERGAFDIAAADVNADDRLDLVTSGDGAFSVLYQDAAGVFGFRAVDVAVADARLRALEVARVDGDDSLDILGADDASGRVIAAFQETAEAFTTEILVGPSQLESPVDLEAVDLDGNGRLDLVLADVGDEQSAGAALVVCLADAAGEFSCDALGSETEGGPAPPMTVAPRTVALSDLDSDGMIDVAIAGSLSGAQENGRVIILSQDRGARFSSPAETLAAPPDVARPRALVAADLGGDGRIDLATLGVERGDLTLLEQDAAGAFTATRVAIPAAAGAIGPIALAAGDVDGDGRVDLATANVDSASFTVLFQDAAGGFGSRFASLADAAVVGPESLALGDVEGDGRLDVVVAGRVSGSVAWFEQSSAGGFGAARPLALEAGAELQGPLPLAVADLDGDGLSDIAAGGHVSENVVLFFQNEERGVFAAGRAVALPAGSAPIDMVARDIDRDGDLDLVVASLGGAPLVVLRQGPVRTFGAVSLGDQIQGITATSLAVGDIDGNGRDDIAIGEGDEVDSRIHVFLAEESGEIAGRPPLVLRSDELSVPVAMRIADVDGDGEPDLVSANRASETITVFRSGR